MKTLRSVAQLLGVPYTDLSYAVVTNGVIEPTRVSDWYWLCSDEQIETLRQYFAARTAAKERRQILKTAATEEGIRLMGETRDRLIERIEGAEDLGQATSGLSKKAVHPGRPALPPALQGE